MRKLLRDRKGAVTIIVTLLLVPAILVSGTGVDLARIYAARTTVRDANQLAANSVLTSYDALLQDLYGLYAIAETDDNLAAMVKTYVEASLFGTPVTDAQLNEFRLFGGQESVTSETEMRDPLRNVQILRRQIEEYAKWRVPVAIVSDIIERFSSKDFDELKGNNQAAVKKVAVDEQLMEVAEKYKAVKDAADKIHKDYLKREESARSLIEAGYLDRIQQQFKDLLEVREDYEAESDVEQQEELRLHYNAIIENINSLVNGGQIGKDWKETHFDNNGNEVPAGWINPGSPGLRNVGIIQCISDQVRLLKDTEFELDTFVTTVCAQANAAKRELETRLDALQAELDKGECNADLAKNMGEEITKYRELLVYDFEALGNEMMTKDMAAVKMVTDLLEGMTSYGNLSSTGVSDTASIPFSDLGRLESIPGYYIDLLTQPNYSTNSDKLRWTVNTITRLKFVRPASAAENPFKSFRACSDTHKECYDKLGGLGELKSEDAPLTEEEETKKSGMLDLFDMVKEIWDGITDYDPSPGARSYDKSDKSGGGFASYPVGPTLDLGLGDFGDGGLKDTLKVFMKLITGNTTIGDVVSSVLTDASNRVLLVGYGTQMFTCWTTEDKDEEGNALELVSLTGKPIDAAHNYFYRSELEYLYNGSLKASDNLKALSTTIMIIRFIANYASSYIIQGVNADVRGLEAAVSAIPFAGAALRFLVRPLIVFGETVMDLARLREKHGVVLLKLTGEDWMLTLGGKIEAVAKDTLENAINKDKSTTDENGKKKEKGLLYSDYLTIFLLAGDPDAIAARTGDLIALNVPMAKSSVAVNTRGHSERATAMKDVTLFDLSKAYTGFSITTTTSVRLAFLSLPFARTEMEGAGLVPLDTFPVSETVHRGY